MESDHAVLSLARLVADGVALAEALLTGDLLEGRFRARLIAGEAALLNLPGIEAAAFEVVRLLGATGEVPQLGHAQAMLDLSCILDRSLTRALS